MSISIWATDERPFILCRIGFCSDWLRNTWGSVSPRSSAGNSMGSRMRTITHCLLNRPKGGGWELASRSVSLATAFAGLIPSSCLLVLLMLVLAVMATTVTLPSLRRFCSLSFEEKKEVMGLFCCQRIRLSSLFLLSHWTGLINQRTEEWMTLT